MNISGEELTMGEIREIAAVHGILSLEKFYRKDDLIRTIQLAQGTTACFKLDSICSEKKCRWIIECQRD
ncbi:MAG: hypothetical protein HY098_03605 [Nitrospinae bacterium]|nr:hypothetical protein [Nitrospinota bacterium]